MGKDKYEARNRSAASSGRLPYVPAYVAELYDSRLSPGEKVLLWKIRYRAGTNGVTWVSWRTLVEESDCSRSTVMRQVEKLQELGFLSTETRGFAKSSNKVVESPSELYPAELCDTHVVGRYFKRDRSAQTLAELMSKTSSVTSETVGRGEDCQYAHESHQWDHSSLTSETNISVTSETNEVSPVGPKLDKGKLDKGKLDKGKSCDAGHRDSNEDHKKNIIKIMLENDQDSSEDKAPKKTSGDRLRDRWKDKPHDEESKTRSDNERQAAAQAAADEAHAASREQRVRDLRKAQERRDARRLASDAPEPPRLSERTMKRLRGKSGPSALDVMYLYYEKLKDCFPAVRVGSWRGKELSHARSLLDDFGWDLVERVIVNLFDNWPKYSERMKNDSEFPSIGWIYAARQQLFGEIQKTKKTVPVVERATPIGQRRKQGSTLGE